MNLFEFDRYKDFVRKYLRTFPRNGHGQYLKMAKLLGIHTTMITHIFKGDSNLSIEQALKLSEHFGFSEVETDFFILLVQKEKASNLQSRDYFDKQLNAKRTKALDLGIRLKAKKVLDERDQAIYYSAWYYSAIRLLTATRKLHNPESIANALGLTTTSVARVLEFLLETGLLTQKNGYYEVGEASTYVNRESRMVANHHLNWRLLGIEKLREIPEEDLVFTSSVAISKKDFLRIREEIVRFLENYKEISEPSASEELCFLNIDWRRLVTQSD